MHLVRVAPPAQGTWKALRQTQWANKSASPPSPQNFCVHGICNDSVGDVSKRAGEKYAQVTSVKSAAAKPLI